MNFLRFVASFLVAMVPCLGVICEPLRAFVNDLSQSLSVFSGDLLSDNGAIFISTRNSNAAKTVKKNNPPHVDFPGAICSFLLLYLFFIAPCSASYVVSSAGVTVGASAPCYVLSPDVNLMGGFCPSVSLRDGPTFKLSSAPISSSGPIKSVYQLSNASDFTADKTAEVIQPYRLPHPIYGSGCNLNSSVDGFCPQFSYNGSKLRVEKTTRGFNISSIPPSRSRDKAPQDHTTLIILSCLLVCFMFFQWYFPLFVLSIVYLSLLVGVSGESCVDVQYRDNVTLFESDWCGPPNVRGVIFFDTRSNLAVNSDYVGDQYDSVFSESVKALTLNPRSSLYLQMLNFSAVHSEIECNGGWSAYMWFQGLGIVVAEFVLVVSCLHSDRKKALRDIASYLSKIKGDGKVSISEVELADSITITAIKQKEVYGLSASLLAEEGSTPNPVFYSTTGPANWQSYVRSSPCHTFLSDMGLSPTEEHRWAFEFLLLFAGIYKAHQYKDRSLAILAMVHYFDMCMSMRRSDHSLSDLMPVLGADATFMSLYKNMPSFFNSKKKEEEQIGSTSGITEWLQGVDVTSLKDMGPYLAVAALAFFSMRYNLTFAQISNFSRAFRETSVLTIGHSVSLPDIWSWITTRLERVLENEASRIRRNQFSLGSYIAKIEFLENCMLNRNKIEIVSCPDSNLPMNAALLSSHALDLSTIARELDRLYSSRMSTRWLTNSSDFDTYHRYKPRENQVLADILSYRRQGVGRLTPFVVLLTGNPGIGKTDISLNIFRWFAHWMKLPIGDDIREFIYTRPAAPDFMDGLRGSMWGIEYQDMSAEKLEFEDSARQNEFIDVVGSYPMISNQAALEDKGQIYVEFRCVVVTSNTTLLNCNRMNCPAAVYRRFDMIVEPIVKPEFRKKESHQLDGAKIAHLNSCLPDVHYFKVATVQQVANIEDIPTLTWSEPMTLMQLSALMHDRAIAQRDIELSRKTQHSARAAMQFCSKCDLPIIGGKCPCVPVQRPRARSISGVTLVPASDLSSDSSIVPSIRSTMARESVLDPAFVAEADLLRTLRRDAADGVEFYRRLRAHRGEPEISDEEITRLAQRALRQEPEGFSDWLGVLHASYDGDGIKRFLWDQLMYFAFIWSTNFHELPGIVLFSIFAFVCQILTLFRTYWQWTIITFLYALWRGWFASLIAHISPTILAFTCSFAELVMLFGVVNVGYFARYVYIIREHVLFIQNRRNMWRISRYMESVRYLSANPITRRYIPKEVVYLSTSAERFNDLLGPIVAMLACLTAARFIFKMARESGFVATLGEFKPLPASADKPSFFQFTRVGDTDIPSSCNTFARSPTTCPFHMMLSANLVQLVYTAGGTTWRCQGFYAVRDFLCMPTHSYNQICELKCAVKFYNTSNTEMTHLSLWELPHATEGDLTIVSTKLTSCKSIIQYFVGPCQTKADSLHMLYFDRNTSIVVKTFDSCHFEPSKVIKTDRITFQTNVWCAPGTVAFGESGALGYLKCGETPALCGMQVAKSGTAVFQQAITSLLLSTLIAKINSGVSDSVQIPVSDRVDKDEYFATCSSRQLGDIYHHPGYRHATVQTFKRKSRVIRTPFADFWLEKFNTEMQHGAADINNRSVYRDLVTQAFSFSIDSGRLNRCVEALTNYLDSKLTYEPSAPFDEYTTINGAPGVSFVEKMNLKTAAGYPTRGIKRDQMVGTDPVAPHTFAYKLTDDCRVLIEDEESKLAEGFATRKPFMAYTKDEPRKLSKISEPRIFTAACLSITFLMRMYFLPFVRLMGLNQQIFMAYPGIVPQSNSWEKLRAYLVGDGTRRIIDGDYKGYDKRMHAIFILAAFSVIIHCLKKMGYDSRATRICWSLAWSIAFPLVILLGEVYCFSTMNPSGHPLTVQINCLVNVLFFMYIYSLYCPLSGFFDDIRLATYGDDFVASVSAESSFPISKFSEGITSLGGEVLNSAKTGPVCVVNIDQVTFLKRFWRSVDGVIRCPIEFASRVKCATIWVDTPALTNAQHMREICVFLIREAFEDGRAAFDKMVKMVSECADVYSFVPPEISYDLLLEERILSTSGEAIPYDDPLFLEKIAAATDPATDMLFRTLHRVSLCTIFPLVEEGIKRLPYLVFFLREEALAYLCLNHPASRLIPTLASDDNIFKKLLYTPFGGSRHSRVNKCFWYASFGLAFGLYEMKDIFELKTHIPAMAKFEPSVWARIPVVFLHAVWASLPYGWGVFAHGAWNTLSVYTSTSGIEPEWTITDADYLAAVHEGSLLEAESDIASDETDFDLGPISYGQYEFAQTRLDLTSEELVHYRNTPTDLDFIDWLIDLRISQGATYPDAPTPVTPEQRNGYFTTLRSLFSTLSGVARTGCIRFLKMHFSGRISAYDFYEFCEGPDSAVRKATDLGLIPTAPFESTVGEEPGPEATTTQETTELPVPVTETVVNTFEVAPSNHDLSDYFSRPVQLYAGTWSEGQTIYLSFSPLTSFLTNVDVARKILNHGYLRFKSLSVQVMVSLGGFRYTRFMLSHHYQGVNTSTETDKRFAGGQVRAVDMVSSSLGQQMSTSQRPNIQWNATARSSARLELGFVYPKTSVAMTSSTLTGESDLFGITTLQTMDILRTVSSANTDKASYTLLVWLDGAEISAPTYYSTSGREKFRWTIPDISPYVKAFEMVVKNGAILASIFGFSKYVLVKTKSVFLSILPGTSNADIAVPGESLHIHSATEMTLDRRIIASESSDPLSIGYLVQKPSYVGYFDWASTAAPGATVGVISVGPFFWNNTAITSTGLTTPWVSYFSPVSLLAQYFTYWRGSMIYDFSISGVPGVTQGQLRLSYDTFSFGSAKSTLSNVSLNKIIDIDGPTDFSMTVPWTQDEEWLPTGLAFSNTATALSSAKTALNTDFTGPASLANGALMFTVSNQLSSIASGVQVRIYITARAGPDFEFAIPNTPESVSSSSMFTVFHTPIPPALTVVTLLAPRESRGRAGEQEVDSSEEEVIESTAGEMNIEEHHVMEPEFTVGERINSLRQLFQRSYWYSTGLINSATVQTTSKDTIWRWRLPIFPLPPGNPPNFGYMHKTTISAAQYGINWTGNNPIHALTSCFTGWRGSFTYRVITKPGFNNAASSSGALISARKLSAYVPRSANTTTSRYLQNETAAWRSLASPSISYAAVFGKVYNDYLTGVVLNFNSLTFNVCSESHVLLVPINWNAWTSTGATSWPSGTVGDISHNEFMLQVETADYNCPVHVFVSAGPDFTVGEFVGFGALYSYMIPIPSS